MTRYLACWTQLNTDGYWDLIEMRSFVDSSEAVKQSVDFCSGDISDQVGVFSLVSELEETGELNIESDGHNGINRQTFIKRAEVV